MQETKTRTPAEDLPPSRPGWIRAVAIVGVGALLLGTLYGVWQTVASSDDPDPIGSGASEPDFSLTNEQAIERFTQLLEGARNSALTRDVSVLPQVFTSDSPMMERAQDVIQRLKRDQIFDESEYETTSVEVTMNTPQEILLLERVLAQPCFRSEAGEDVTTGSKAVRYQVEWIMRLEGSTWLLHESRASNDEIVDDAKASC